MAAELGSYKQVKPTPARRRSPWATPRVVEGPALSQGAGFQSPSYAWRDWVVEAPATTATQTTLHWPLMDLPAVVVSLLEGGPTSPFRAEPGRVPWAKTRPPGAHLASPNPRPGSRVGPRGVEYTNRLTKGVTKACFSIFSNGMILDLSEQSLLTDAFASKQTVSSAGMELTREALKELREGIKTDLAAMRDEILSSSISTLQATISVHGNKIADIETSLTDVDGRVSELETSHAALQVENSKLHAKLDSLENFSRRNNLRVTGLEEKIEGNHPSAFMEKLLINQGFWRGQFYALAYDRPRSPHLEIAAADRSPACDGGSHALLPDNGADSADVVRERPADLPRSKYQLLPRSNTDLLRRRAAFLPVKKQLREAGVKYCLLHPARLQFAFDWRKHKSVAPSEAAAFVKSKILPA
ncbi:hypothetical protein L3Q82_008868, partial [Scortum barcoo]